MDPQNLGSRLMELILNQAKFLVSRQVRCEPHRLIEGEKVRLAPFDGAWLEIEARRDSSGAWTLSSGQDWQAVSLGVPFRLSLTQPLDSTQFLAPALNSGLSAKFRRYAAYPDLHRRLPIFAVDQIKRRTRRFSERPPPDKRLRSQGGLTFVAECQDDVLELVCLDDGGIFDMNLNTEGDSFPWQVPVGYYSTEYAAFVFAWLAERDGGTHWRDAAERSVAFGLRNLEPYTVISFDHYEFKVMPLCAIRATLGYAAVSSELSDRIAALEHQTRDYEPINVFCMRVANLALTQSKDAASRAADCITIIERNTTAQGQIQDNYSPASLDNHDLTYHQFSIACLAVAKAHMPADWDPQLRHRLATLLDRGVEFSQALARPDGHPSYLGRGCNNIYHLASYIFAVSSNTPRDFNSIGATLALLEQFDDVEAGLPSCLNDARDSRMGWNHCSTPYIGQTLFFLALAYDAQQRAPIDPAGITSAKLPSGAFTVLESGAFHATIFAGGDTYSWCGGMHATGMAGLASLCYSGVPLLGALEHSTSDALWFTDLPYADAPVNGVFRHSVRTNDCEVQLSSRTVTAAYNLSADAVTFDYKIEPRRAPSVMRLCLREDTVRVEYTPQRGVARLRLANGSSLDLDVTGGYPIRLSTRPCVSNAFGPSTLLEARRKDGARMRQLTWKISVSLP